MPDLNISQVHNHTMPIHKIYFGYCCSVTILLEYYLQLSKQNYIHRLQSVNYIYRS